MFPLYINSYATSSPFLQSKQISNLKRIYYYNYMDVAMGIYKVDFKRSAINNISALIQRRQLYLRYIPIYLS